MKNEDGVEVAGKTLGSTTEFGWNITGGLRLYFTQQIAFDANVQYDIVGMEQYSEEIVVSVDSEFVSAFAGLSVSFGVF